MLGDYNEQKVDTKVLSAQVLDYGNQIKDRNDEITSLEYDIEKLTKKHAAEVQNLISKHEAEVADLKEKNTTIIIHAN